MTNFQKLSLTLLRISLGWLFLYSGITKILNPNFTAAGYLKGAQTFKPLFDFFAASQNIGFINILNEWGQLLIGIALIIGIGIRLAGYFGIPLMILYYLPILNFPYVGKGATSFLVDEHFLIVLIFLVLMSLDVGKYYSLRNFFSKFLPKSLKNYL